MEKCILCGGEFDSPSKHALHLPDCEKRYKAEHGDLIREQYYENTRKIDYRFPAARKNTV